MVIFAVDLAVKALVSCNYAPGYYQYVSSGQANDPSNLTDWTTTSVKPGRMRIGQAIHGAYQEYEAYSLKSAGNTTYSPDVFIDTILHGYYKFYLDVNNADTLASDSAILNIRLKKFFGEYGLELRGVGNYDSNIVLTIENDFEYETRRSYSNIEFNAKINVVNESVVTIDSTDVPQFNSNTYSYYDGDIGFNYLSLPSRRGITNATAYKLYCNSNSILKSASLGYETHGVWFNELVIENAGETIDTVSSSPATSLAAGNQSYQDSSGNKFFVAYESTSNNAVNLIPHAYSSNSNYAPVALEYKSPSAFSGKTCWRLFGTSNGYSYKQMYRLELPNFSNATSDYTFETFFNTTASPGVDITINLYVYGLSSGLAVFKRLSPTVSGTTISFSDTFSPGELKAGLVSQLFAEVVMTKTSTANCSVAFNNFSLT